VGRDANACRTAAVRLGALRVVHRDACRARTTADREAPTHNAQQRFASSHRSLRSRESQITNGNRGSATARAAGYAFTESRSAYGAMGSGRGSRPRPSASRDKALQLSQAPTSLLPSAPCGYVPRGSNPPRSTHGRADPRPRVCECGPAPCALWRRCVRHMSSGSGSILALWMLLQVTPTARHDERVLAGMALLTPLLVTATSKTPPTDQPS